LKDFITAWKRAEGDLDVSRAPPLFMTGSKKGMHFCNVADMRAFEPFSAMFPEKKDPLEAKYR
jgi:hypothetical protein